MIIILKLLLSCFIFNIEAKHMIPDWIHICRKNDPELNACALKNARIAIPSLVKGYRPYGLPRLAPLDIPRIEIQAGSNLKIELTKNKVYGLGDTWINDVDFQIDNKRLIFNVTIPMASIVGNSKMDGQILILPINGEGPANVTLMDGNYIYTMDFEFVNKSGERYLNVYKHSITFTTSRAYYHFDNLFHGESNLGERMNQFLDENWKDVTKDLGATVAETISSIITSIAQKIFDQVPYEELLLAD